MDKKNIDKNAGNRFIASEYDTSKGKQRNTEAANNFNKALAEMNKRDKK